jgi:hypothetical protein
MTQFTQQQLDDSRAGKFSKFLTENPTRQLISLSEEEKDDLIKQPTPIIDNAKNEILLILLRALQKNPLAQERVYSAYLKQPELLLPKILLLLTGRTISYELKSKLVLGEKEEVYRVSISKNSIRVKFENYLPAIHADEKGEVVNISLAEIDTTTGVHPVVKVYASLSSRKPISSSLAGAHRTKIKATLDLDQTFNSDQWAFLRLIVALPDQKWEGFSVFVNLVHTKSAEIEAAAKEALNDFLAERGTKEYRIFLDIADWGPLSKIQLQAKAHEFT